MYEHKTIILENVDQSVEQALREGEKDTQKAGVLFQEFMDRIDAEGWEIVAVNRVNSNHLIYTLKRPKN